MADDSKVTNIASGQDARGRQAVVPESKILLPEGEYTLRVDFNTLAEIEESTGRNMMDPTAFQNVTASYVRKVLFICVKQKQPQVTETEIGRQLSLGNMSYVLQTLVAAWVNAMPKKDDQAPPNVPLQ